MILYVVFFYVRYGVSFRDLEEIMAEWGLEIDHTTLNRWVVKFLPLIAASAQARKRRSADGRDIHQGSRQVGLSVSALDRGGQTLEFMLSERRNTASTRRFFKRGADINDVPDRIAIDKSGASLTGL